VTNKNLPTVIATISQGSSGIYCELLLNKAKAPHYLTMLEVPRGWAERSSLRLPSSFQIEPLPPDGVDPNWAREWNLRNLRLVGCMELEPNVRARVFFPAHIPVPPDLVINGQFTSSRKAGGTLAFFRATFAEYGSIPSNV